MTDTPRPNYKTRPARPADPGRRYSPAELAAKEQRSKQAPAAAAEQQLRSTAGASRTIAWVLFALGALFALVGLTFLFGTSAISGWIFGSALLVIGATAIIVGSALLSVLGAL